MGWVLSMEDPNEITLANTQCPNGDDWQFH